MKKIMLVMAMCLPIGGGVVELGNPATGWETRTCFRRRILVRSLRPG